MTSFSIQNSYAADDLNYLHEDNRNSFDSTHVAIFQRRKQIDLSEPIQLAMELPEGAWIGGGFFKDIVKNSKARDYTIFFSSSDSFLNTLKRIYNAPADSFLHGYESDESANSFNESDKHTMVFTHATKPVIQLVRVRWYGCAADVADKQDFSICQFVLGRDLKVTYFTEIMNDLRYSRARLKKIIFETSTALRLKRLTEAGFTWYTENYDGYNRDELTRAATQHITEAKKVAKKAGKVEPINVPGYLPFTN